MPRRWNLRSLRPGRARKLSWWTTVRAIKRPKSQRDSRRSRSGWFPQRTRALRKPAISANSAKETTSNGSMRMICWSRGRLNIRSKVTRVDDRKCCCRGRGRFSTFGRIALVFNLPACGRICRRSEWLLRKMRDNVHMQTGTWLTSRKLAEAAGPWDKRLASDDDGEYYCRVLLASKGTRSSCQKQECIIGIAPHPEGSVTSEHQTKRKMQCAFR